MSIETISLSGKPEEIGYQHGCLLAEQIHKNIDFYRTLFLNSLGDEAKILGAAERFKESIQTYNPDFVTEIEHVALGADVSEPLWLYALNSRTELSMMESIQECTAIVCPRNHLLAQTWDWAQKLEGNFVIMKITFPNGHKILQLTEAGIIGKIGLNNHGLGVTLNFLYDEHIDFSTVPIHIVLRQVLECRSLEEAKNVARKSGIGKASNLIISQAGEAVDIEFAGDLMKIEDIESGGYVHTNHFLHAKPPNIVDEDSYNNSVTRHKTAKTMMEISRRQSLNDLIDILSNQANGKNAILAGYKLDPTGFLGEYGTLATIVMDLKNRTMLVRKGNPANSAFSLDSFDRHQC